MWRNNIHTLPVADIEIPTEVSRLYDLAYNFWWTWHRRAQLLFSAVDPERWAHDPNPVELLINVPPHRWDALLPNESFMSTYHAVVEEMDRYLRDSQTTWFRSRWPDGEDRPVAYFSTEYGWHESVTIYSGGLGILSGDHTKAASDLGIPFVGVGLLYRRGYIHQLVDAEGDQQHVYPVYDPRRLPFLPVTTPSGRPLRVSVEFPGRKVHARIWKADIGRTVVLLLDTDVPENDPADRPITSILYVRGREMRLCQELILGIGGVRALRALGIEPCAWHINEGHSALLNLERAREQVVRKRLPFQDALADVRKDTIFTTHTPVPAGNESFDEGLVRKYLTPYAGELGLEVDELLACGRAHPGHADGQFNLTAFAIRTSRITNAVSRLHGKVASDMWRHLFPPEAGERPIDFVTNGVHIGSWLGQEMEDLYNRYLGGPLERYLGDPNAFREAVLRIPSEELWSARQAQKARLIQFTRTRLMEQFARHGRSPDELRELQHLLDPGALTVGFARRFTEYKRAALLFHDTGRLHSLLSDPARPVQILFAGKAHPADRQGQDLIRRIFQASLSPEFRGRIVFLENYDIRIARALVQGVDLWLNTPRRPMEACGTSGMKAALNGALNCSVLDGWWAEAFDPAIGWAIGEAHEGLDPAEQDRRDAEALYETLGGAVVPSFYDGRDEGGWPEAWLEKVRASMAAVPPRFCAHRMLRDYAERFYFPPDAPPRGA